MNNKVQLALDDWHGLEFYERADVKKTRKTKWCNVCNTSIPSGSSHSGYRFYGEDGDWPVFIVCTGCKVTHSSDLNLIREHTDD